MPDSMIAYCGPAAVPDDLWTRWNVDPLLMVILAGRLGLVAADPPMLAQAGGRSC
jgi:putative membrane protein